MKQTISTRKETVAANLKKFRKENHFTQKEVSEKVFMNLKNYQKCEEGRVSASHELLFSLKELYNLTSIECFFE